MKYNSIEREYKDYFMKRPLFEYIGTKYRAPMSYVSN